MTMKIHNEPQGSPQWLALRAKFYTASEASAMMGVSKSVTRTELIEAKKYGGEKEINFFLQRIFDKGHETEAMARPHIEDMIGDDLYPTVGSLEVEGLPLLASFDGITMLHDQIFEHKQWNEVYADMVRNGEVPPEHVWQLEQGLLVSGAERALFVISDGTPEKMESIEYVSVPERREALIKGWHQLDKDIEEHVPHDDPEPVTGEVYTSLPVPVITMQGSLDIVNNNLPEIRKRAEAFVTELAKNPYQTDQDFADAENAGKILKEAEDAFTTAIENVLAQFPELIDAVNEMRAIKKLLADTRIPLGKKVDTEKKNRRREMIEQTQQRLSKHIEELTEQYDFNIVFSHSADFAGVIKGKRSPSSIRDALDTELARVKIELNDADKLAMKNVIYLNKRGDYRGMFHDLGIVAFKEHDDFVNLVDQRIRHAEETFRRQQEKNQHAQADTAKVAISDEQKANENSKSFQTPAETVSDQQENKSDKELVREWCDKVKAAANGLPTLSDEKLQKFLGIRYNRVLSAAEEMLDKIGDNKKAA